MHFLRWSSYQLRLMDPAEPPLPKDFVAGLDHPSDPADDTVFDDIPNELRTLVLAHLDARALATVSCTSKGLKDLTDSGAVWERCFRVSLHGTMRLR